MRLEQLFAEAVELPSGARPAFLDRSCGEDVDLRQELDGLLSSHDATGVLDTVQHPADNATAHPSLAAGICLGPWRVGHLIGRGGMGEVYAATRTGGAFEQRAALKLLRFEAVGQLERFHAERRILASLEHPGIARLLDGGMAPDGRPYTVMEYVEGRSLTDYCREHRASLSERLALFTQVCDAVAFAHRNLVVHRDLKPANILVDADGAVKLLDFGIAKLLDAAVAPGEADTTVAPFTPDYAAPEQLSGQPVTTATDIYALGVLLFELLTGQRPLHMRGLPSAHAMKLLLERNPPPASRIAQASSDPPVPARMLTGDLDAIVARCLRKEAARRYETVNGLKRDIERHLHNEPVFAREGARLYVAGRLLRRYRMPAAALFVLMFTIAGAAVYAQLARTRAEAALRQTDTIRNFLIDLFALNEPEQDRSKPLSARELVDLGARRAEVGLGKDPDTRVALLGVVGKLYESLGEYERSAQVFAVRLTAAERRYSADDDQLTQARLDVARTELRNENFDRARVLLGEVLTAVPARHAATRLLRARALSTLASLESARGDYPRAMEISHEVIALTRLSGTPARVDLAGALVDLGIYTNYSGRIAAAEAPLRQAVAILAADGNTATTELLGAREQLSVVLSALAQFDEALMLSRANVALVQQVFGRDHPMLANQLFNLATIERRSGDPKAASELYRQALRIYERAYGAEHSYVATALTSLGQALSASNEHQPAIDALERAERIYLNTLGPSHQYAATGATALAAARLKAGDAIGAEAGFRMSIARYINSGNGEHIFIEAARSGLGEALSAQHRYREAEPLLRQAWQRLSREFGGGDFRSIATATALARCLASAGRGTEADVVLSSAQQSLASTATKTAKTGELLAMIAAVRSEFDLPSAQ